MPIGYLPPSLASSFEIEGDFVCRVFDDRGDADVPFGLQPLPAGLGRSRIGDRVLAALQWCAEFCRRKTDHVAWSAVPPMNWKDALMPTSPAPWPMMAILLARDLGHDDALNAPDRRQAISQHFAALKNMLPGSILMAVTSCAHGSAVGLQDRTPQDT